MTTTAWKSRPAAIISEATRAIANQKYFVLQQHVSMRTLWRRVRMKNTNRLNPIARPIKWTAFLINSMQCGAVCYNMHQHAQHAQGVELRQLTWIRPPCMSAGNWCMSMRVGWRHRHWLAQYAQSGNPGRSRFRLHSRIPVAVCLLACLPAV